MEPERFPIGLYYVAVVFTVGGHCRAAFQSAHMNEYGYLRVSGELLLRCRLKRTQDPSARALPTHVSSQITICRLGRHRKSKNIRLGFGGARQVVIANFFAPDAC